MTTRKYSSRAQQTTLTSGITSIDSTMVVGSGANLMGGKTPTALETYTVVIDPDTALEEIVDVHTYTSGNTLNITRSIDTTGGALAHSAGAIVRHMVIGRDLTEANTHIEGTLAGHAATTSAQLAGVISDETGSGSLVFATSPTLVTPALGTPASGVLTNATGLPLTTGVTGTLPVANGGTGITSLGTGVATFLGTPSSANLAAAVTGETGSGAVVFGTSPTITSATLTTPAVGSAGGTFAGSTSGTTTLVASAVASGTVTLPAVTGTVVTTGDTGTVTSTMILDGTIVNADINASAAVAYSKLALTGAIVSTDIANDTILNADINTAAAIAATKIAGTAVTQADSGTVTSAMILDGTIVNADINASAAIDWTKLGISSTVSSTEIGYVDGVTSAIQTQIDAKLATTTAASTYAPLASPTLTGVPLAPTAAANTNTTQIATTAYVQTELTDLLNGAPGALDTLNELATALGNDANYSTTITTALAGKLPLAGGTMTGAIAMGTSKITGLGTPTLSTDASTKAYADLMLPLTGGTMSGAIAMGTNKITGVGDPTNAQDVVTKYYLDNSVLAPSNLTGPITSVGAATTIASQTGTGTKFVVDTSPTIVTPTLSGATVAGTINGTTIPSTKTLVVTTDKLSALAATTSAELAGVISDETGSGALVFATSPNLMTPVIASIVNTGTLTLPTSTDTLVGRATTDTLTNKTLGSSVAVSYSPGLTFSGSTGGTILVASSAASGTLTLPAATDTLVGKATIDTLTNKTLTSPTLTAPVLGTPASGTLTNATGLPISGLVASTSTALGVGSVELGHATDTTLARVSAGVVSIEGVNVVTTSSTDTLTNKTLTTPVITNPKITLTYSAKTAAYTAVSGDEGGLFSMNNASSIQFNIPTDATFNFAVGTQFNVFWLTGAGQPTIGAVTPGTTTVISTGATSATPKLRVANAMATCIKIAANSWIVVGDIA